MKQSTKGLYCFCFIAVLELWASRASAVPCYGIEKLFCTYANNPEAMVHDIGPLLITTAFQTWPDGTPTLPGQELTTDLNYTSIGVSFSAPIGSLHIRSAGDSRVLEADSGDLAHDWIVSDFITLASAIAIRFSANSTLYAFDARGNEITSISYFFPGGQDSFLGISSDIPIARAIADGDGPIEIITCFGFNVVPEPSPLPFAGLTIMLLTRITPSRAAINTSRRDV